MKLSDFISELQRKIDQGIVNPNVEVRVWASDEDRGEAGISIDDTGVLEPEEDSQTCWIAPVEELP